MRDTREIVTTGGTKVEIYTYITGRESREISNVFLEGMKFQVGSDGQTKSNELDAKLASQAQDKTIELLVRSVNGDTTKCLANVLDLPKQEFDEVLVELEKVSSGLSAEKKTV